MLIVGVFLIVGVYAIQNVFADSPKGSGVLEFSDETMTQAILTLGGTEQHIGRYTSYGELDFVPGAEAGTLEGTGVVVLEARNGDLLVGGATAQLDGNNNLGNFHFSWRDSVTLRDGRAVSNTGRFLKHRPPGLVVIATVEEQNIVTLLIRIIFRR